MKILTSSLFIYLIFILSCSSVEKETGVLSESQMVSILLDIYGAESDLADLRLKRDTAMAIFKTYEGFIFEQYGINREQYKKSLAYYYDHSDLLENIYDSMIDSLTLQESKIKAMEESERNKRDSLARAARKGVKKESDNNDAKVKSKPVLN